MPRAYYRPFTAYEEVVGFKGAKRNAHIFCGLFLAGICFKVLLAFNFSPASNRDILASSGIENDPSYIAAVERRAMLAESWTTRDSMKQSTERRRHESTATRRAEGFGHPGMQEEGLGTRFSSHPHEEVPLRMARRPAPPA